MIRTVNPYNTARTAEIMSRYRPIAPKPEVGPAYSGGSESSNVPLSMRRSAYLRNVWNHLQARPTRTRKRGRSSFAPIKRPRTCLEGLSPPYQATNSPPYQVTNSPTKNLAVLGFAHNPNGVAQIPVGPNLVPLKCGLNATVTTPAGSVALPVLRPAAQNPSGEAKKPEIDLNLAVEDCDQELEMTSSQPSPPLVVITPRAVRPIGSTITVKAITINSGNSSERVVVNPAQVEEEVEAEVLPAVVSDSSNKVRLTNSAYKEMVGQPECSWLDFVAACGSSGGGRGGGGGACKRIGGEVLLQVEDSGFSMSLNGFNCWVKIEWASNGKTNCVNAFCEATKLDSETKDYKFLWRFYKSEALQCGSNI